jgi:ParB-like chromosome segregation protein Spo0J
MPVTITRPEGAKEDLRWVNTEEVYPNDYNPNVMADHVFGEMASDIKAEGMDQPVVCVLRPVEGSVKCWRIVDGEHRWKSHSAAGATLILISVKEWTDDECKIRTIRRNFHGEINPEKFTKLIASLQNSGLKNDEILKRMAMTQKTFSKLYQGKTEEKAKGAAEVLKLSEKSAAETFLVANLSQMVRDIVKNYGENLAQGFVCFSYKGQTHLMISMDAALMKAVQEFKAGCDEDKKSADQIAKLLAHALTQAV